MEQLDTILSAAYEKKASDVHLVVGSAPVFRVDGKLIPQKKRLSRLKIRNSLRKLS